MRRGASVRASRVCVVCGCDDGRALLEVELESGDEATLCGSHALMLDRASARPGSADQLKQMLRDRRDPRDRRITGDELGDRLGAAFNVERRVRDRRTA
jgi:hypothetical protein